tara:strand:+ start:4033 stop:9387 length:5355 start_codon:yes stop_codon:yes gene_type:complete
MAFKINKAKSKLTIQPKNHSGQTQKTLDLKIHAGIAAAGLNLDNFFNNLIIDDEYSSETMDALQNRHVSKAFEDLYKRGINPLRAEVLLASEFVPLAAGNDDETIDEATININYGTGGNLRVNQVMRLIDLQRIIRKTMLKIGGDFLEEFIGYSNLTQLRVIELMHDTLHDNVDEFLSLGTNTEAMVNKLIELSTKQSSTSKSKNRKPCPMVPKKKSNKSPMLLTVSALKALPLITKSQAQSTRTEEDKAFDSIISTSTSMANSSKNTSPSASTKSVRPAKPLLVVPWIKSYLSASSVIKKWNSSDRSGFLKSLARYVILDYVTQNSIAFITRIYDLKDTLRDAISIANTGRIPPGSDDSGYAVRIPTDRIGMTLGIASGVKSSGTINKINTMKPVKKIAVMSKIDSFDKALITVGSSSGINVGSKGLKFTGDRAAQGKKLLDLYGMPASSNEDGFSKFLKHSLSKIINVDVDPNAAEEVFGSNRHMYVNLFSDMLRKMLFLKSLDAETPRHINQSRVSFSSGGKNLAEGIKILKSITPQGFISSKSPLRRDSESNRLDGQKISAMLSAVSDDKEDALCELVAAVCYDQVAGVNAIGGIDNLLTPNRFENFPQISIDNIIVDFFNKTFFDTGKGSWSDFAKSSFEGFDYKQYAKDENKLGKYMKSRFAPREDQGTKYIPNEHTYEDNPHREDSFLAASDYFFSKALSSEDLNFDVMAAESRKVDKDLETIVHDISSIMGFDFDDNGDPAVGGINAFSPTSNPLAYFYAMCDTLGEEARKAHKNLESHALLAAPVVHAGKLNDLNFTADAIKASFFTNLANGTNNHMCLNLQRDDNGKLIDKNLIDTKACRDSAAEEAICIFNSEARYHVERKIWIDLFKGPLENILKKKSAGSIRIQKDVKYPADTSKDFDCVIYNHKAGGVAEFNDTVENKSNTYEAHSFGENYRVDYGHHEFVKNRMSGDDTEKYFGDRLNMDSGVEPIEIFFGALIGVAIVCITGGAAAVVAANIAATAAAAAIVAGATVPAFFSGAAFLAGMGGVFVGGTAFYTAGAAAAGAAAAWALVDKGGRPDSENRPFGLAFSQTGFFETILLSNAALIPPEHRPTSADVDADMEEKTMQMMKTFYGLGANNIYILKGKSGNGDVKQWESLRGIVDVIAEIAEDIWNWITQNDEESEGTVDEKDIYKPYYFEFNNNAGKYGGLFKTTIAQRYTLFFLYFSRIMYHSLNIRLAGQDTKFEIKIYPSCWLGMADALQRKSKDSDFSEHGEYSELKHVYDHAYDWTHYLMDQVRRKMKDRRSAVLRNLVYLKQNSIEIRDAVNKAEDILAGASSHIPKRERLSLGYLRDVGFAKTGMSFLNENTAGILMQNYQKNYIIDPASDSDESKNPEGISVFPFFKKESYDLRDLKLMGKVFSEKGKGLTSHDDDNLGRKLILHVGIPTGLVRALQNEAYSKTDDIEYFYSNNIALHITKINDLEPSIKYQSRTYVFNMSKYVTPFKYGNSYKDIVKPGNFDLSNHIKNYNDTWDLQKIKDNLEVMTAHRKKPFYGLGRSGIMKIDDSKYESIYSSDIYDSMLQNHTYDYFAKLYTESTTGINISEVLFPIDGNLLFDGTPDPASMGNYDDIVEELILRYPSANINADEAQHFYRVTKAIKSSLYFSAENRYQACLGTQCFQRIFSIPISERDFALKQSSYNLEAKDIYVSSTIPKLTMTNEICVRPMSIKPITSVPEVLPSSGGLQPGFPNGKLPEQPAAKKIISEYKKAIDPFKTEISSYIIEVALLKSSKLE